MRRTLLVLTFVFALVPVAAHAQSQLPAMEREIQSGNFQKIGSILIEQDGHLVYEHYFEGNASTLRDTRSATKTITSILTGIAVDEHKIPSVSVAVVRQNSGRV